MLLYSIQLMGHDEQIAAAELWFSNYQTTCICEYFFHVQKSAEKMVSTRKIASSQNHIQSPFFVIQTVHIRILNMMTNKCT